MDFLKKVTRSKWCFTVILLGALLVAGAVLFFVKYLNPNVESLDPVKLNSVKGAYLQEMQAKGYAENMALDDVYIIEYYGTYRECIVVMLTYPNAWYTCMMEQETIADVTIQYKDSNRIKVYKDGSLYSLQEAYDMRYLTKANIKRIKNIHCFSDKEFS